MPTSLERLWHQLFDGRSAEPADVLISLVYYATLEMGFVPAKMPNKSHANLATHWAYRFAAHVPFYAGESIAADIIEQRNGLDTGTRPFYEFHIVLANLVANDTKLIVRKIFSGAHLLISLCSDPITTTRSVVLDTTEFVASIEPARIELRNVDRFVANIKYELIEPVRNALLQSEGYPHAALDGLTEDTLWPIFKCFRHDLATLQSLSHTCVFLRNMTIAYVNESKIQLKQRRPTPFVRDASTHRRPRIYGWRFPLNFPFGPHIGPL